MIKQGVVRAGKSPSAVSGRPSEMIKAGEALLRREKTPKRAESLAQRVYIPKEELDGR